jgi:hypothetical protein
MGTLLSLAAVTALERFQPDWKRQASLCRNGNPRISTNNRAWPRARLVPVRLKTL